MDELRALDILLTELFFLAQRIGLWNTANKILNWKIAAKIHLNASEREFLAQKIDGSQVDDSSRTVSRTFDGRSFRGREFVTEYERLGTYGKRQMQPEEARRILQSGSFGISVFRGIDVRMLDIISNQDRDALFRYGVRDEDPIDLSGKSAFVEFEMPLDDQAIRWIRDEFKKDLNTYDASGRW